MKIFYVPLALLSAIIVATLFNNFLLAEKIAPLFWLSFSASLISSLLYEMRSELMQSFNTYSLFVLKKLDIILSKTRALFIACGIIALLYGFTTTKFMGGDDTRVYFEYPFEYFTNFSSHVASNNAFSGLIGFLPPPSISPFVLMLSGVKTILPFLNLQAVYFVGNITFGFFFFFQLLLQLFPKKSEYQNVVFAICSLLYVFSQFNIYTLYSSQTLGMFVVSVLPCSLYLFSRSIRERKLSFLIIIALLLTLFSVFAVGLPWFAGSVLVLLPIAIYISFFNVKRSVFYFTILCILLALFNANWLAFVTHSPVVQNTVGVQSSLSSTTFREMNEVGIRSTAAHNNPLYAVLNIFPKGLQTAFNWPYLSVYRDWYSNILLVNGFFVGIFVSGLVIAYKKRRERVVYLVTLVSFLVGLYLFIVNFGSIGVDLFILLTERIPGFVMFRNMYDKFALGFSLAYSLLLASSFYIVMQSKISDVAKRVVVALFFFVMVLNLKPVLFNDFSRIPLWTTEASYGTIKAFNSDFELLLQYMKSHPTDARYLLAPLASGNIFPIEDRFNRNNYYVGVSPLFLLTGQNDYSGILSFGALGEEVRTYLREREYEKLRGFFKEMNVGYIIKNNSVSPDIQRSYIYSDNLIEDQDSEFFDEILGSKIADFGSRYSLYSVKDDYIPQKVFIADNPGANVTYEKTGDYHYVVHITNAKVDDVLAFLEPLSGDWILESVSGIPITSAATVVYNGYANSWKLTDTLLSQLPQSDVTREGDDVIQATLSLSYVPQKMYTPTFYLSYGAMIVAVILLIVLLLRNE